MFEPENSFECTRCGTVVSINDSRCPNCGMNLYPEEDEEEPARPSRGISQSNYSTSRDSYRPVTHREPGFFSRLRDWITGLFGGQ